MFSKCWQVIKDDSKKTFEVVGQAANTNAFTNSVFGMQRAGMNVSFITPPVGSKISNRDAVKVPDYKMEEGLHERLVREYQEILRKSVDEW